MAKFKIGDRVKFLTEKGGGIVVEIVSPSMVKVETEDGFAIPYMTRDLIPVQAETLAEKMFIEDSLKDEIPKPEVVHSEEVQPEAVSDNPNISKLILYPQERKEDKFAVYLAFVPQHQGMLITGEMDIYLINFSAHRLFFSMQLKGQQAFHYVAGGEMPEFSKYFLESIEREQLDSWLNANLQLIFAKEQSRTLLSPMSVDVRIKGSRFYKESAYQDSLFFREKAFLYTVVEVKNIPVIDHLEESMQKSDPVVEPSRGQLKLANDEILKHKTGEGEAEVDMHIWQLVSDYNSMSNQEMLDTQLAYFERCLESAIMHKFHKVIFIHGVGSGKLKQEIQNILDQYEGLKYRPAPMAEYGVGATRVDIPENY